MEIINHEVADPGQEQGLVLRLVVFRARVRKESSSVPTSLAAAITEQK